MILDKEEEEEENTESINLNQIMPNTQFDKLATGGTETLTSHFQSDIIHTVQKLIANDRAIAANSTAKLHSDIKKAWARAEGITASSEPDPEQAAVLAEDEVENLLTQLWTVCEKYMRSLGMNVIPENIHKVFDELVGVLASLLDQGLSTDTKTNIERAYYQHFLPRPTDQS